jgi:lysozyme
LPRRKRRKSSVATTINTILFFTIVTAGFICYLIYEGYIWTTYPFFTRYPIRGIDISHHQGKIQWQKIAGQKIDFAYIKATEGISFVDPAFTYNWNASSRHGIIRGAYHFFSFTSPGSEQGKFIIQKVPNKPGCLPLVIDVEFNAVMKIPPQKKIIAELKALIKIIQKEYGYTPVIYTTYEVFNYCLINCDIAFPIWIKDISTKPSLQKGKEWLFWQYSHTGKLNGINGHVDLNVFNGNRTQFESILTK